MACACADRAAYEPPPPPTPAAEALILVRTGAAALAAGTVLVTWGWCCCAGRGGGGCCSRSAHIGGAGGRHGACHLGLVLLRWSRWRDAYDAEAVMLVRTAAAALVAGAVFGVKATCGGIPPPAAGGCCGV